MSTIPAIMREADRWLRWRLVSRPGQTKPAKIPVTPEGRPAKVNDPSTWGTFADAAESTVGRGLGFILGEGVGCIDLDDAILPDGIAPWAECLLDALPPTFVEVSQSGTGLHIFGYLAEGPGRNYRTSGLTVEQYSKGRYIATTGDVWEDAPATLADITPLTKALSAL